MLLSNYAFSDCCGAVLQIKKIYTFVPLMYFFSKMIYCTDVSFRNVNTTCTVCIFASTSTDFIYNCYQILFPMWQLLTFCYNFKKMIKEFLWQF